MELDFYEDFLNDEAYLVAKDFRLENGKRVKYACKILLDEEQVKAIKLIAPLIEKAKISVLRVPDGGFISNV